MKKILLQLIVIGVTLALVDYVIPGVTLSNSLDGLVLVTLVFAAINTFVKPLLKILSLPIEVATLGLFTVVINTILLLVVDYVLVPLTITSFWFPGFSYGPIIVAPMRVPALLTAIVASALISTISSGLIWLTK